MNGFQQSQLRGLEGLSIKADNRASAVTNPSMSASFLAQDKKEDYAKTTSIELPKINSAASTAFNTDVIEKLNSIREAIENQTKLSSGLPVDIGFELERKVGDVISNRMITKDDLKKSISYVAARSFADIVKDIKSINKQSISDVMSSMSERFNNAQYNAGRGVEARSLNAFSSSIRSSNSEVIAFRKSSKDVSSGATSIEDQQTKLLGAIVDINRFQGQELVSIRNLLFENSGNSGKGAQNEFDSFKTITRTFGQVISDTLAVIPVLSEIQTAIGASLKVINPIVKTAFKAATAILTPYYTVIKTIKGVKGAFGKVSDFLGLSYRKSTKDTLKSAGLDLDIKKSAYNFIATALPVILEETRTIVNKQLDAQNNIYDVMSKTYSVLSGQEHIKQQSSDDSTKRSYDPLTGEFISQEDAQKRQTSRLQILKDSIKSDRGFLGKLFKGKDTAKIAEKTVGSIGKDFQTEHIAKLEKRIGEREEKRLQTIRKGELILNGALLAASAALPVMGAVTGLILGSGTTAGGFATAGTAAAAAAGAQQFGAGGTAMLAKFGLDSALGATILESGKFGAAMYGDKKTNIVGTGGEEELLLQLKGEKAPAKKESMFRRLRNKFSKKKIVGSESNDADELKMSSADKLKEASKTQPNISTAPSNQSKQQEDLTGFQLLHNDLINQTKILKEISLSKQSKKKLNLKSFNPIAMNDDLIQNEDVKIAENDKFGNYTVSSSSNVSSAAMSQQSTQSDILEFPVSKPSNDDTAMSSSISKLPDDDAPGSISDKMKSKVYDDSSKGSKLFGRLKERKNELFQKTELKTEQDSNTILRDILDALKHLKLGDDKKDKKSGLFSKILSGLGSALGGFKSMLFAAGGALFTSIGSKLKKLFSFGGSPTVPAVPKKPGFFSRAGSAIKNAVGKGASAIKNVASSAVSKAPGLLSKVGSVIGKGASAIKNVASSAASKAPGLLSKVGSVASKALPFASKALGVLNPVARVASAGYTGYQVGSYLNDKLLTNDKGEGIIGAGVYNFFNGDDKYENEKVELKAQKAALKERGFTEKQLTKLFKHGKLNNRELAFAVHNSPSYKQKMLKVITAAKAVKARATTINKTNTPLTFLDNAKDALTTARGTVIDTANIALDSGRKIINDSNIKDNAKDALTTARGTVIDTANIALDSGRKIINDSNIKDNAKDALTAGFNATTSKISAVAATAAHVAYSAVLTANKAVEIANKTLYKSKNNKLKLKHKQSSDKVDSKTLQNMLSEKLSINVNNSVKAASLSGVHIPQNVLDNAAHKITPTSVVKKTYTPIDSSGFTSHEEMIQSPRRKSMGMTSPWEKKTKPTADHKTIQQMRKDTIHKKLSKYHASSLATKPISDNSSYQATFHNAKHPIIGTSVFETAAKGNARINQGAVSHQETFHNANHLMAGALTNNKNGTSFKYHQDSNVNSDISKSNEPTSISDKQLDEPDVISELKKISKAISAQSGALLLSSVSQRIPEPARVIQTTENNTKYDVVLPDSVKHTMDSLYKTSHTAITSHASKFIGLST